MCENKHGTEAPGNPREIITMAERRFPVRIEIGLPPAGLGQRHTQITAWLDENCGSDGWAMTPSGTRGVLNDAISVYFADATLASAFVARWCTGHRVETAGGVFHMREDEPGTAGRGGVTPDALTAARVDRILLHCRPAFETADNSEAVIGAYF